MLFIFWLFEAWAAGEGYGLRRKNEDFPLVLSKLSWVEALEVKSKFETSDENVWVFCLVIFGALEHPLSLSSKLWLEDVLFELFLFIEGSLFYY